MTVTERARPVARVILPTPHDAQSIFVDWEELYPDAQVLIAPCGTKVGKTFGASLWMLQTALANPNFYCVWIAPTLYKCRIAYRYMKAMLPDLPFIQCRDGALEIIIGTTIIKFLHGRDAEVTVEGEAIDAFVIDEAGKQKAQLWFSLFTTITQTGGKGIVTGTPRGTGHWYYTEYKRACDGDPFYCHVTLKTIDSPFISKKAVEQARRILPAHLFNQYYEALFTSESSVYGSLSAVWTSEATLDVRGLWFHPDEAERKKAIVVGYDIAKRRDYAVFFAVNADGQTVGYCRFRGKSYREQMIILKAFVRKFTGAEADGWSQDNEFRYDRTGVGDAVGEMVSETMDTHFPEWQVSPVVFTNAGKQEMVSRIAVSIEDQWWKCPRIPRVETEFQSLEVLVSKSGLNTYAAPDGDHDDVHWAAALAISAAYMDGGGATLDMIEAAMSGKLLEVDDEAEDDIDDADADIDALLGEDDDNDLFEGDLPE